MAQRDIKTVFICNSAVITAGIDLILGSGTGIRIVENFTDLSEAASRRISSLRPDAVILDPAVIGAENIHLIRECCHPLQEVALVGLLNAAYPNDILRQFDSTFTLADHPASIVRSVREAVESFSNDDNEGVSQGGVLSSREKEILAEVAAGRTNKEIADKLHISVFTVTTHRKNISQKLGIRSIAGLTVYAVMNNIIEQK